MFSRNDVYPFGNCSHEETSLCLNDARIIFIGDISEEGKDEYCYDFYIDVSQKDYDCSLNVLIILFHYIWF